MQPKRVARSTITGGTIYSSKRVTKSTITRCPFLRPEGMVPGQVGRGGTIPGTIPAKRQRGAP